MNTHADNLLKKKSVSGRQKSQSVAHALSSKQRKTKSAVQILDNRPEAVAQRKLKEMVMNSSKVSQLKIDRELAHDNAQNGQHIQLKADANAQGVVQLEGELVETDHPSAMVQGEAYYREQFLALEGRARKRLFMKLSLELHPDKTPGKVATFDAMVKAYRSVTEPQEDVAQRGPLVLDQSVSPSAFLSEELGVPINQNQNNMIPQQIHRFWSGGKMTDEAMQVLIESAAKTEDTAWQNNMWYSSTLERMMDEQGVVNEDDIAMRNVQRDQLRILGYNVREIEEIAQDDPQRLGLIARWRRGGQQERGRGRITKGDLGVMAEKATRLVQTDRRDRWDGVKHISDMARLMYLDQVGGHHLDVDMGLGQMDLSRPYYHNDPAGNIPLMGAVTATEEDPIAPALRTLQNRGEPNIGGHQVREAGRDVATQARDMTDMLNGMLASRPGNENIKVAIEQLRTDAVSEHGEIPSGMIGNNALIFGQQGRDGRTQEEQRNMKSLAIPPYLFDLEHLTAESENR